MNVSHHVKGAIIEKNGKEHKVGFVVTHVDQKAKRWFGKAHLGGSVPFQGNFMHYGTHRKGSLDQGDTNPDEEGEEELNDLEPALFPFSQPMRSTTMPISSTLGNLNVQHASNARGAYRFASNAGDERDIPTSSSFDQHELSATSRLHLSISTRSTLQCTA
jgi:hypothetical protein